MSDTFDRMQAQGEREAARQTVPQIPAKDLDEAFQNTHAWLNKTESERRLFQEGRSGIEDVKARATAMGVEMSDKEAVAIALQLDQRQAQAAPAIPAELQASMQAVRELYGDQVPFHQAAQRYAEIDKLVRSDPVEGVRWIAEQSGLNPLQLAQQLAMRYGNQQVVMQNAENIISQYFESNPDASKYEAEILAAIEGGKIKRTGHITGDLHRAFQYASKQVRKAGKRSTESKFRSMMEAAYDRAKARK